jgi:hypothetical protein
MAAPDMFDPNEFEGLLNEDLQIAIEAVTADDNTHNRRKVYEILLKSALCVPSSGTKKGKSRITATQNEEGELALPAFSDPVALRRWDPDSKSMLVMTAEKLFQMAVDNDFAEIQLNPAGPAGGKLTPQEFRLLAKGLIPE